MRYPLLPRELGYFLAVESYDVAIIGGGPAGSTAATLLSKAGRRVIVLERDKFPRFHIGESLLPFSMQTFTRLGLQEKLRAGFARKIWRRDRGSRRRESGEVLFQRWIRLPAPIVRIR